MDMILRHDVLKTDPETVREIVKSTGAFFDPEVDVAVELVEERLARGEASGYYFVFAENGGRTVGYTCYGPIACTKHSFDLFWMAVHDSCKGRGLGRSLMAETEQSIARMGGRRIYLETSSRSDYARTRAFYEACDYRVEAVIEDFYGPGDGKVIFVKCVEPA